MITMATNLDAAWRAHNRALSALARGSGRVFTPRALALRLAEYTLAPFAITPTVLDPACGAGALLLGALEFAANERPQWLEHWARGGLEGWEIDAETAHHANEVLALAFRALGLPPRNVVTVRDGLDESGHWDAVLANPPWISFSGRQAARLPTRRREDLARRFASFRRWPSLHAAFSEQAARLAPEGRIGLLLPMQVAYLGCYAAAREAMTARHGLEAVQDLGERAFEGVTEPCGMFILGPAGNGTQEWNRRRDTPLLGAASSFATLPAGSFGDVGVHTGNAASQLLRKSPGAGLRPLRVGADVRAFKLAEPALWLREAPLPAGRYARVPGDAVFARVRIVIRQTADRPIAARHKPAAAFRNSVLACFGAPGHDDDFLLGVLNSDVLAHIHRALHRDARQRAFPQVKIAHLRALPIPGREIGPAYDGIADLSRRVQAGEFTARGMLEAAVARVYRA